MRGHQDTPRPPHEVLPLVRLADVVSTVVPCLRNRPPVGEGIVLRLLRRQGRTGDRSITIAT